METKNVFAEGKYSASASCVMTLNAAYKSANETKNQRIMRITSWALGTGAFLLFFALYWADCAING